MTPTRFGYRAANALGIESEGEIEAPTEQNAVDALRKRALWVTEVWPIQASGFRWSRRSRPPAGALAATTRSMAVLLASGVTLERVLDYAATQSPKGVLRDALVAVRQDVRNGRSLSDAMRAQSVLPSIFPALVATGEATGTLDGALARLAEHVERSDELAARMRSALIYPSLLGIAAILGVATILLVVVPRFAILLDQAGGTLPLSTRVLVTASTILTKGWLVWLIVGVASVFGWRRWIAIPGNGLRWHDARLRFPIAGALERSIVATRYTRTLALALPSGAGLLTSMRLARAAVHNLALAGQLEHAEQLVRDGTSLSESLGTTLPPLATQLLDAGEASGALAVMSARASDALDAEVQRALTRAVTLIEPVLILGFGALIGFVALGLLQAIYGINASVL